MRKLCRKTQWKSKKTFFISKTFQYAKSYNKHNFRISSGQYKNEMFKYYKGLWHLKGTAESTEILQNGLNIRNQGAS